ncbi:MAG: glycosyltransferase family 4 protein [Actinomycetota bacterium]|nr:glycosyltransferase family 4 protein [Actinomycetota bacterium]
MTAVHQFVPALLPRDATGDHTRALRDAFVAAGWESRIFAEAAHDEICDEAIHYTDYPSYAGPDDVLLYQVGTASPVSEFLLSRREPLVLDYHNITPGHFYAGWEDETAARVGRAREQLAALAPRAVLGIADSAYNAAELAELGCRRTEVVPIVVDVDGWAEDPDPAALAELAASRAASGPVWLFVGRLSPNKAQHVLVEALWLARRWFDPDTRLHLVGPAVTGAYAQALDGFVDELGLAGAVRRGEHLSPAELAAWFRAADVFVCVSEHEGFCIPLVEAMRFDLPIVALAAGAVPETAGDAAVLLGSSRPATVATAAHRVATDDRLRGVLAAAGRRRLASFDPARSRQRFLEVLGALAGAPVAS